MSYPTPEQLNEMDRKAGQLINANNGQCELIEEVAITVTALTHTVRKMCQAEPPKPTEPATQWAVVELMGHVRIAGRISEEERFGGKVGRLDIPEGDGFTTQYFGHASIYRVTICSEQVARDAVARTAPLPVRAWDYPEGRQLPGQLPNCDDVSDRDDDPMDDDSDLEEPEF